MQKSRAVIYVNFAQYDNAGRILDYLTNNFHIVAHFSFDHLRLRTINRKNFLHLYKDSKLIESITLLNIRTPRFLLFPSLPIVALLIFFQLIYFSIVLARKNGAFNLYFTVNAYTAWIGLCVKSLGLCKKTVFWVWDYYPLSYADWKIRSARWVYWQFDKFSLRYSDHIAFTNKKLLQLSIHSGFFEKKRKPVIVPIGSPINIRTKKKNRTLIIGFLGMLKETQGIDLLLDTAEEIFEEFPKAKIEIIGSGPEEQRFKLKVKKFKDRIQFLGFIKKDDEVENVVNRWSIGIATYLPSKSNESYWGDPSKIKTYFGNGVPVITTNVSYFTSEIRKYKAGIIIQYKKDELIKGIKEIITSLPSYRRNALELAKKYDYKELYPKLFDL